jgi:predicted metal-dependent enzyme (double-stranded beta helix superfamily)
VVTTDVAHPVAGGSSSVSPDEEETEMTTMTHPLTDPLTDTGRRTALADLTADLDRAVRGHGSEAATADAVSRALAQHLGAVGLLTEEQREGDPERYRQHVLHVADDGAFSLVALVWLPGQATPVHDHVCWCVVGVHEGEEEEIRYALDEGRLVVTEQLVNPLGEVSIALPPGDIHLVRNAGTDLAVSLHVYGADLRQTGTSIRRRYDLPVA